jgi:hypothetical protein
MLLKTRRIHPSLLFRIGMGALALSQITGYFAPRMHFASEAWVDGTRGFLLGISLGLLLLGLMKKGRGGGGSPA